jgi:ParB/RepB/Spo0J family partition protein
MPEPAAATTPRRPRTTIDLTLVGARPSQREATGVRAEARRSIHPVKVAWIAVGDIDETPPELNSRRTYDEASINELAASVQEHGILQPLCVRPDGERYTLVFGLRRLKAATRAGLQEVPCTIRVADDDRAFLLNTIENLHRQQLSGAERLRAIERLAATNLSGREISRRTGFSQATISRWLRLDRRPPLKQAVEQGLLDIGRAMVLSHAPEAAVAGLVSQAHAIPQPDLWRQVSDLKASHNDSRRRVSVDSRRIMEALRLLSLVQAPVAAEDRRLLLEVQALVDELIGPARRAAGEDDGSLSGAAETMVLSGAG